MYHFIYFNLIYVSRLVVSCVQLCPAKSVPPATDHDCAQSQG